MPSRRPSVRRRSRSRSHSLLVRVAAVLGLGAFFFVSTPSPAFAGGDCVDVYVTPTEGTTICTPWGG